ncbi:MAG: acyltransferase [Bacteroidia bacterium]|nr:acyltransferase [Bacteroidia bacterium]
MSDKLFFVVQGFLKYNAFSFGVKLRRVFYRPFFKSFGRNIQIQDGVTIKYPSEIELGDNIKIGQQSFFVGKGGLKIGSNTMIGAGTKIITSSHNFESINQPMTQQGLSFESIVIEEDVWFGFDVKVFGGSVIRKGCILGTNSLVNKKEFASYSIIGGTPAKLIRMRTDEKN